MCCPLRYLSLRAEHEDLTEKLQFFTRESSVDISELESALTLVKVTLVSTRRYSWWLLVLILF